MIWIQIYRDNECTKSVSSIHEAMTCNDDLLLEKLQPDSLRLTHFANKVLFTYCMIGRMFNIILEMIFKGAVYIQLSYFTSTQNTISCLESISRFRRPTNKFSEICTCWFH